MAASEQTHLIQGNPSHDAPSSMKVSFLVGLVGVLVGAAVVSFSTHQPHTYYQSASGIPILGKEHDHKDHKFVQKEVVDKGNWIEEFGVSRGVVVAGGSAPHKTLYLSGQTSFNGTAFVGNDMGAQLAASIENVDQSLKMAGMTKCDIVKIFVFVTSTDDVLAEWEQYDTWLADCSLKPANTLVGIQSLFDPDALIEIDVTAIH